METFTPTGLPDVLAHLRAAGWRIWPKSLPDRFPDRVNWYAGKRIPGTRSCEANEDKPGAQVICDPTQMDINGHDYCVCPIHIIGEYQDVWYKLEAYTLRPEDLPRLPEIEARLAAAWNALANPVKETPMTDPATQPPTASEMARMKWAKMSIIQRTAHIKKMSAASKRAAKKRAGLPRVKTLRAVTMTDPALLGQAIDKAVAVLTATPRKGKK